MICMIYSGLSVGRVDVGKILIEKTHSIEGNVRRGREGGKIEGLKAEEKQKSFFFFCLPLLLLINFIFSDSLHVQKQHKHSSADFNNNFDDVFFPSILIIL